MLKLTNDMITQNLIESSRTLKLALIAVSLLFLGFVVLAFIKMIRGKDSPGKIGRIIAFVVILILIGIPGGKIFIKYSSIQSAIDKNQFEIVTDTVENSGYKKNEDGNRSFYVYLTNNGKISVTKSTYSECYPGTSVYVVVVKGIFGEKYPIGKIYLTSKYQYVN